MFYLKRLTYFAQPVLARISCSQSRAILPPRECLAMSRDIFVYHMGSATGISWVEDRVC